MSFEGYNLLIAIYAAVVSTAVAIFQFIQYREAKKYIHITASRAYALIEGTEDFKELIKFKVSNRSKGSVEIQDVFVYNFGLGGEAGFHDLAGHSLDVFKDDGAHTPEESYTDNQPLSKPLIISPGETVCAYFSSNEAIKFTEPKWSEIIGAIHSDLFLFEVEHSRSDNPSILHFEIADRYLPRSFSNWKKLIPAWKRRRYRPIDRAG